MKCLIVKPNFARWIVKGVKTQEYRKHPTYVRGRIGIMETGGDWHSPCGLMHRIVGDVELFDCIFYEDFGLFAWMLTKPRQYRIPVFAPIKRGPVVWCNAEYDTPHEFITPKLTTEERISEEIDCVNEENRFFKKWKNTK